MADRIITAWEVGEQSAHKLQRPFGNAVDAPKRLPRLDPIRIKPVQLNPSMWPNVEDEG